MKVSKLNEMLNEKVNEIGLETEPLEEWKFWDNLKAKAQVGQQIGAQKRTERQAQQATVKAGQEVATKATVLSNSLTAVQNTLVKIQKQMQDAINQYGGFKPDSDLEKFFNQINDATQNINTAVKGATAMLKKEQESGVSQAVTKKAPPAQPAQPAQNANATVSQVPQQGATTTTKDTLPASPNLGG